MPYAHFTYTVIGQRVVSPNDVRRRGRRVGYRRLVLSACTPLFSAEKRLLVFARLTRTVPVGAARSCPGGGVTPADRSAGRRVRASGAALGDRSPAVLEPLAAAAVSPLV